MEKKYINTTDQGKIRIRQKSGRKLSKSTNAILDAFKDKFGAVYVSILKHWPSIIGDALSKKVVVAHLKYYKNPKGPEKAVLTLYCPGAMIPMMQMQLPQIIYRINQYFGYSALHEIRLIAKHIVPIKKPAAKPDVLLNEQAQSKLSALTHTISNDHLKNALHRLGESILKKDVNNHADKE